MPYNLPRLAEPVVEPEPSGKSAKAYLRSSSNNLDQRSNFTYPFYKKPGIIDFVFCNHILTNKHYQLLLFCFIFYFRTDLWNWKLVAFLPLNQVINRWIWLSSQIYILIGFKSKLLRISGKAWYVDKSLTMKWQSWLVSFLGTPLAFLI